MYVTHAKLMKMLEKKIIRGKQKLKTKKFRRKDSIELKKLKECKKAATTAASKSIEAFDAKIFAIKEKLRKF